MLVTSCAAFAALIGLGTAGMCALEGWTLLQGAYWAVVTLSTVGYGQLVRRVGTNPNPNPNPNPNFNPNPDPNPNPNANQVELRAAAALLLSQFLASRSSWAQVSVKW